MENNKMTVGKWVYDNFIPWIEKYAEACKEFPEAIVYVSR